MSDSTQLERYEQQEPEQSALVPYHPMPPPTLFGTSDPAEVIAKATAVASALKDVLKRQGLISNIQGKEYPKCEAWTLLGTILGVFPVLQWTKDLENGYEARVEARTKDGAVVGAAEAICTRAEKNWSNRDDFALKSMAQTRATAKALRMPLGFVMTLAGYQATPAEEMDFERDKPAKAVKDNVPRRTSAPTTQSTAKPPAAQGTASAPMPVATEKTRAWFLGEMRKRLKDLDILQWACDDGPPYRLMPDQTLEEWPLTYVPTSRMELDHAIARCAEFVGVTLGPVDPPSPQDDGDLGPQTEAEQLAPQFDENGDEVETVTGKLEQVSEKSGQSKQGKWVRYGLKVGNDWYGTFDKVLGELAKKDKNHCVKIQFRRGEKGNDLISIERPPKV